MTWFNFPGWGDYNLTGLAEKQMVATFAHGYATQAEADANPNAAPNPQQAVLLESFNVAAKNPIGAGVTPGVLQAPGGTGGVTGAAKSLLGGGWNLTFGNTTGLGSRILKVLFGAILITAGIVHMTGVDREALGVAKYVIPPTRF